MTLRKLFSVFASLALLVNTFSAPALVLAQESTATPEATPVETVAPTEVPTPTEVATPTVEPTEEPSVVPTPTLEATVAPTVAPTFEPTTEPTVAPSAQPVLTTDKEDYHPGETATITGRFFNALQLLVLKVFGGSQSDGNYTEASYNVVASSTGTFSFGYLLDSIFRPLYTAQVFDASGNKLAETTFTDSNPATDISQCQNGGVGDPLQPCSETAPFAAASGYGYEGNAAANFSNSHWHEGEFVPLRIVATNYSAGAGNIQFSIDVTKGGKHAYDYVGSFDTTETTGNSTPSNYNHNNPVTDIISGASATIPDSVGAIPVASLSPFPIACGSNTFVGTQTAGVISAWGTSSPLTVTYVSENVGSSDCTTTIQVAWTGTKAGFGGTIVLAYAAHIAKQSDWGAGNSAISISGDPYHSSLVSRTTGGDTKGIGNQDAKLAANAIIIPSTLTVNKVCEPTNDLGKFNLRIDGATVGTGENAACGGTTGAVTVNAGNHTVSETAGTDTSLTNYSSVISGDCTSNGSVSVAQGENKTCTITNTLQLAHLTLQKTVVNDNGGSTADTAWTLSASGPTPISGVEGNAAVTNAAVNSGSYNLSESAGPANYTNGTTWVCVGGTTVDGDTVSLAPNESATCTITNNDNPPQLHLTKTVTNDNGGTALNTAWTLTATGTGGSPTNLSGSTPVNSDATFKADTYVLSETSGPTGYTAGAWNCGAATMPDATHVTVPFGGNVTCTINNDDNAPGLHLRKVVVNDNGGTAVATDWTLSASGPTPLSGTTPVDSGASFDTGTYNLSESGPTDYTASDWVCVGKAQDDGDTITLGLGESSTCTITNNDNAPSLTLVKVVTNNNGGTAVPSNFSLQAAGPDTFNGPGPSVFSGFTIHTGTYSLSETTVAGYTGSAWVCVGGSQGDSTHITLGLGQSATCTITNDDNPPQLKLVKVVTNNDGGTAIANDWDLTATGSGGFTELTPDTANATFHNVTANVNYALSENPNPGTGYSSTGIWACTGTGISASDNTHVTVSLGGSVTCTVTNTDNTPQLKLVKVVDNDDGGSAAAVDYTLSANASGDPLTRNFSDTGNSITFHNVAAGASYALSELPNPGAGYTAGAWSCTGTGVGTPDSTHVTVALGGSVTCTIHNTDNTPQLKLVKTVTNNNGGSAVANNWNLSATASNPNDARNFNNTGGSGVFQNVFAGVGYVLSEQNGPAGYTAGSWSCDKDGALTGTAVTLALGDQVTCTINNDDQQSYITVTKVVNNTHGGTAVANDFNLTLEGTPTTSGAAVPVNPGTYTAGETLLSGYTFDGFTGDCDSSGDTTVALGQSKTCTLTNSDVAPKLHLRKVVVNDNGGTATLANFTLTANGTGSNDLSGTSPVDSDATLQSDTWALSETTLTGYTASAWSCVGGTQNGANITVGIGGEATCTITNDDVAPKLHLRKVIVNDNGGTAGQTNFVLKANGTELNDFDGHSPVDSGSTLKADTWALDENHDVIGYAASAWVCVGGTQNGSNVTLGVGEEATCTITNDDIQPKLTLVKHVVNNNGGTLGVSDFPLFVNATGVISGVKNGFNAGNYTASETNQTGYAPSVWSGGCLADGSVTLGVGDDKTCEITNDDISPTITIIKDAQPNDLEDFHFTGTLGAFALDDDSGVLDGDSVFSNTAIFPDVVAGTQSVTEIQPNSFWTLASATCVDNQQNPVSSTLTNFTLTFNAPLASNITCKFVNTKPSPTRTLGFWQTHTTYTEGVFSTKLSNSMPIGTAPHKGSITTYPQLFGAFYAPIAKQSDGKTKRSAVDQARIQLLQQLVAAKLNCAAFGCDAAATALISTADSVYFNGTAAQILASASALDGFNNSGDTLVIGNAGSATPQTSKSIADLVFWNTP